MNRKNMLILHEISHNKLVIMRKTLIMSAMAVLATPVCSQKPNYPSTARCDTVDEYFGTQVPDPYRWLEDDTSEATAAWVAAENAVTNEYLSRLPRRRQLLDRLREVSNYEKTGIPSEHHGKWYFYKNDGLQNQAVLYVMDELGGEPTASHAAAPTGRKSTCSTPPPGNRSPTTSAG